MPPVSKEFARAAFAQKSEGAIRVRSAESQGLSSSKAVRSAEALTLRNKARVAAITADRNK